MPPPIRCVLMRIGYPCVNLTLGCSSSRTFRLASYSEERLISTIRSNLECLSKVIEYNASNGLLFFRITSDLVPFASHPINRLDWQAVFKEEFASLGRTIRKSKMRISMHPDQFILINAWDEGVFERSIAELDYHANVLDLMGLDSSAKIQIHLGGVYGDRRASMDRFVQRCRRLPASIRRRLAIENDDISYGFGDCLEVSRKADLPIIFDTFHHSVKNNGEPLGECLKKAAQTWGSQDGILMVDYSSQEPGERVGKHAASLDASHFKRFLEESRPFDFDLMLEIKDKEKSALKALQIASGDKRLCK